MMQNLKLVHTLDQIEGWLAVGNTTAAVDKFVALPVDAESLPPQWFEVLARISAALGMRDKVMEAVMAAWQRFPQLPHTALRVVRELAATGNDDGAQQFLKEHYPEPIEDWFSDFLVAHYSAHNHPDKAKQWLESAFRKATDKPLIVELVKRSDLLQPIADAMAAEAEKNLEDNP